MSSNIKEFGNKKDISPKEPKEMVIIPNDSLWGEKLRNYQKSKEIFYRNKKDFPKIITKEQIRNSENKYNPITQKYIDLNKDNSETKSAEKRKLNLISKCYDRQLEIESTYNLINLSNKLKHFNYEEPSIKTAPNKNKGYEASNKKPYNILTNYSLKDYNYLSPRQRTINNDKIMTFCKEGLSEFDRKNKKMEIDRYKKDFNIINNEYKLFNKEKKETEKEIQNLNAFKKLKNRKTYDIINCKYINPIIENEFMKNYENKKKLILSKTKDKNYIIRNPINNIIYDKDAQKKLDIIEEQKKRRFILHDKVENYYHSLGNNIETYKNEMQLSHGNPLDLNIKNKRGYDILNGNYLFDTNNSKNKDNLNNINMAQKKTGQYYDKWENIKLKANENSFINKKPIYKEPYDYSDVNKNFEKYYQKRKSTLMNSKNINRSYGTFKSSENIFNTNENSNSNNNNYYKNNYNATNFLDRMKNGNLRKSYSNAKNGYRIDNIIKLDNMDKNKFFGLS